MAPSTGSACCCRRPNVQKQDSFLNQKVLSAVHVLLPLKLTTCTAHLLSRMRYLPQLRFLVCFSVEVRFHLFNFCGSSTALSNFTLTRYKLFTSKTCPLFQPSLQKWIANSQVSSPHGLRNARLSITMPSCYLSTAEQPFGAVLKHGASLVWFVF